MPTGWLAPSGILYECEIYEHHYLAAEIVEDFHSTKSAEDILLESGWAQITKSVIFQEYVIYWNNFLTDYQKNFLKPFFDNDTIKISKTCRLEFEEEMER